MYFVSNSNIIKKKEEEEEEEEGLASWYPCCMTA
jgi:hypothetical protein